jgi:voltage-gated potassium channel Kch
MVGVCPNKANAITLTLKITDEEQSMATVEKRLGGRLGKRLRYRLDNEFSKGPAVLVAWLALMTLIIILFAATVLTATGLAPGQEQAYTFPEAFWQGLLRILGSAPIGGRDAPWGYRILMLGVTFGSLFVFSTVISVLTNGMRANLEELRRGRSEVMEAGHTVILGWSEQIFTILSELVKANASENRACIVVLGDHEKIEMEEAIRHKVGHTGHVRIICRKGNPLEMTDLHLMNLNSSRNIIVLSPESVNPDADVIKIVLAVLNHPERRKEPYHIVASIRNPKNAEVAQVLGKHEVEWIRQGDVISRIISQTSRQSGLSVVYSELLDFEGDEIYFYAEPRLVGKTFGEILLASELDSVIGLRRVGERPRLKPPMGTEIRSGDQLIVIARDNNTIVFQPDKPVQVMRDAIRTENPPARQPEQTLILGWNWRGARIIRELDKYLAPHSETTVVADPGLIEGDIGKDCHDLRHQMVCYKAGDTSSRHLLESLSLDDYQRIILLAYSDKLSVQQADAQTLITLLHLRDLADTHKLGFSIVSEMLDLRNRNLALSKRPDDFIISDRLISHMVAQVAENKELNHLFQDLFDPEGVELYMNTACQYVVPGKKVNFYTVVEAARNRDEVAVGYRLKEHAGEPGRNYGVVLNPRKSLEISLDQDDKVIVLAKTGG